MTSCEIIASFIIRVTEDKKQGVEEVLLSMPHVETHGYEKGKLIITISSPNEDGLFHQYKRVRQIKGVLSTELVFCGFGEGGPNRDMVDGEIPDWLNSDIDAGKIRYGGGIPKSFN